MHVNIFILSGVIFHDFFWSNRIRIIQYQHLISWQAPRQKNSGHNNTQIVRTTQTFDILKYTLATTLMTRHLSYILHLLQTYTVGIDENILSMLLSLTQLKSVPLSEIILLTDFVTYICPRHRNVQTDCFQLNFLYKPNNLQIHMELYLQFQLKLG